MSRTLVEDNLFERCSGEAEIISNKSGENTFRRNVFVESEGTLTLRHGNGSVVDANVFLLSGANGGGVRVVGAGHVITNNYVEGCRASGNIRAGITLMASEQDPAMNGYQQVEDVLVAHNTIADCETGVIFGGGRGDVAPRDVTFVANVLDASGTQEEIINPYYSLESSEFADNVFFGGELGIDEEGFREMDTELSREGVLLRPRASLTVPSRVDHDIDGQPRLETSAAGCDEAGGVPSWALVDRSDVGPGYTLP